MTPEEAHKLLGGYAANTLTERERASLFEAALDDQALFDALHNEDALRELMADPISREQVRLALQPVAPEAHRVPWMRRPWFIGTAGIAAAAVVTVAIMISQRKAALKIEPTQIAESPVELKPSERKPAEPRIKRAPRNYRSAPAIAAPAPVDAVREVAKSPEPATAPATGQGQPQALGQQQDQITQLKSGVAGAIATTGAVPPPRKQELTAGIASNSPLYNGPLVRYSLLRSGPSNAAFRIEVVSRLAGYLALYRVDDAGQWQRVFPVNAPEIAIAANTAYQIPESPIALGGTRDKLRLVIDPAEPAASSLASDRITTGQLVAPRAQALRKSAAPTPLVVEIAIGPN